MDYETRIQLYGDSAVFTIDFEQLIKKTQAAKGVTKITSAKQRSAIHDKMERLLLVWINEQEMKRDVTSMPIIQEKAREIFQKLKELTPGLSSEELEFKATTGWFTKFKRGLELNVY
ncbi:tigger transposable element-derived protein 1-like protein [Trichonephila clavata]|uniref:Tigger transposable element-derived protein 1-like protein n=1 Tax=Trichonephila clavata TaxID=2740835 RepID=A0A8X6GD25_TRICU|nr:tigger transposable element-derived protein 1-like protein [Trichonephila clavata]